MFAAKRFSDGIEDDARDNGNLGDNADDTNDNVDDDANLDDYEGD